MNINHYLRLKYRKGDLKKMDGREGELVNGRMEEDFSTSSYKRERALNL